MLHIDATTIRIGGRVLLDRASARIPAGQAVGLVGPNGAGKSTLLRAIMGEVGLDAGTITVARRARIGLVAQEAPTGERSALETVLAADPERGRLLAEAEQATDPARIAEIHTRLADIGAHAAPARAGRILAGLGFDTEAQAQACGAFAGGWRMRIAIAAMLFAEPDLLLLDEPTNHLDLEAALWLESYLKSYRQTLIVVSHDRTLLNGAVKHILHLDGRGLRLYAGGYDQFEAARRERLEHEARFAKRQAAERARIQGFVDRFRYQATKARQAQSRLKMLAKMAPITPVEHAPVPRFPFAEPDRLAPPIVALEDAAVGYGDGPTVLADLTLRLDPDDRIALIGANGNGKSTFAKLLASELTPRGGEIRRSRKLQVGFFAQHQMEQLNPTENAIQHLRPLMPRARDAEVRARLGQFGLAQQKAETLAGRLSGGEKARLVLCLLTADAPHLVILDEPTNHLDVDSRAALIQAVNDYAGAVVLISHDAHLISLIADRLWLVADGTVRPFDGDLADYRRQVLESRRSAPKGGNGAATSAKQRRRQAATARAQQADLGKAARAAERELERLTAERTKIDRRLADPTLYRNDADAVTDLNRARAGLEDRIAAAEARWLAAQDGLENGANPKGRA